MDDDPGLALSPDMPVDATGAVDLEEPGTEGHTSRGLALAFVALLSILVLLGTTGIAAAASTLLGGGPYDCGGG